MLRKYEKNITQGLKVINEVLNENNSVIMTPLGREFKNEDGKGPLVSANKGKVTFEGIEEEKVTTKGE